MYLNTHLNNEEKSHHFESRCALSLFLVQAHNAVNRRLGKKEYAYTTVKDWYSTNQEVPIHFKIFCLVLFGCIAAFVYHKRDALMKL